MDHARCCLLHLLLVLHWEAVVPQETRPATVAIDFGRTGSAFRHFWKSTGFCPPDPKERIPEFFMTRGVALGLALMGSLPNGGLEQVRIHWLYNLLAASYHSGAVQYNYTALDNLLDFMNKYNLRPGFEMMGYPQLSAGNETPGFDTVFSHFNETDWYNFTKELVQHLVEDIQLLVYHCIIPYMLKTPKKDKTALSMSVEGYCDKPVVKKKL